MILFPCIGRTISFIFMCEVSFFVYDVPACSIACWSAKLHHFNGFPPNTYSTALLSNTSSFNGVRNFALKFATHFFCFLSIKSTRREHEYAEIKNPLHVNFEAIFLFSVFYLHPSRSTIVRCSFIVGLCVCVYACD